ncbi:(p)ppGpp synthase/HD superfamily hydrolase [Bradyrhizobium sp. USDA 4369]
MPLDVGRRVRNHARELKKSRRRDRRSAGLESKPMSLSSLYDEALVYAADLHRSQVRKGSRVPYIAHLLSVSSRVLTAGGSEVQAIAGLLHDAAEDQGGQATLDEIRRRFGDGVAEIVADCTDSWVDPKPAWRPRKEAYLAMLPHKPATSLLVSLADKVDNAEAIAKDYDEIGDAVWQRFSGGQDGTIWYYRTLSKIFDRAFPGPLARQLARTVGTFPS